MNKMRSKFAGFGSGSISKRHGPDPHPYQKVTDSQHCVQLLLKKKRLLFTDFFRIRNVYFGSGSDPAKSFGSFRIRIRNNASVYLVFVGFDVGVFGLHTL
jgi:hypothetical protein